MTTHGKFVNDLQYVIKGLTWNVLFLINDPITKFLGQLHGGLCPVNVDFSSFFVLSSYLLLFLTSFFPFHFSWYFCLFSVLFITQHIMGLTAFLFSWRRPLYHGYIFSVDIITAAANQLLLTIIIFVILIFLPDSPEWPYCRQNLKIYRFWYLNLHLCSWIWLHGKRRYEWFFYFFLYRYDEFLPLSFSLIWNSKFYLKHPIYLFLSFFMITFA